MDDTLLYDKIKSLPEDLKSEVSDFVDFLQHKLQNPSVPKKKPRPKIGRLKGKIKMMPDFDEPLEDFKDYMPE